MSNMNEQQEKAAASVSQKILVLAGAGTGKTTVMIERIQRLVNSGEDPESILALTFTNAAAFEMRERFQSLSESERIPEFRTFHSFCYSLLYQDPDVRRQIGYSRVPLVADNAQIKKLEAQVKLDMKIKVSDKILASPDTSVLSPKDAAEVVLFRKTRKAYIRKANIITFDILARDVCKLFIDKNPLVDKYVQRYKYIFIDEFQDTDPLQWEFAKCFADSNIFVVGDALQAIYQFRGADSSLIKQLSTEPGWEVIKLEENYRCTQDIIELANKNTAHADKEYRVRLHANKEGVPVQFSQDTRASRFNPYSQKILNQVASFCTALSGTSAILVRTNAEVGEVSDYLSDKGIEHSLSKSENTTSKILRCILDDNYMLGWLSMLLTSDQYANYIRIAKLTEGEENRVDTLLKFFDNFSVCSKEISKIVIIRGILHSDELTFIKCNKILDILGVSGINVDTLANTPEDIISYLDEAIASSKQSSLYVGTIHSSKGLEYDAVALLGVDGPTFRLDSEDNKNLYYVGITRAKSHLYINKQ